MMVLKSNLLAARALKPCKLPETTVMVAEKRLSATATVTQEKYGTMKTA